MKTKSRSATPGRYVTEAHSKRNPDTTVKETSKLSRKQRSTILSVVGSMEKMVEVLKKLIK